MIHVFYEIQFCPVQKNCHSAGSNAWESSVNGYESPGAGVEAQLRPSRVGRPEARGVADPLAEQEAGCRPTI